MNVEPQKSVGTDDRSSERRALGSLCTQANADRRAKLELSLGSGARGRNVLQMPRRALAMR